MRIEILFFSNYDHIKIKDKISSSFILKLVIKLLTMVFTQKK